MAYSAVPTVATNDIWSASNHNTYIKDNFADHESRILAVEGLSYTISVIIGDGVSAITTSPAVKGAVGPIPAASTITGWTMFADASGSIVVDVLKAAYSALPPSSSIAGTEKPTLASAQKNQDLSLSSWTNTLAEGDWLSFEVESATTVKQVYLGLKCERS